MKKLEKVIRTIILITLAISMLLALAFTGCGGGVSQADFDKLQSELEEAKKEIAALETQVSVLSTISAYQIWYDQYYQIGAYEFADSESFIEKFGALIDAIGDAEAEEAWSKYIKTEGDLRDVVAELPANSDDWTSQQNAQWASAAAETYESLGELGDVLFDTIGE
jgi:hypothetical protein